MKIRKCSFYSLFTCSNTDLGQRPAYIVATIKGNHHGSHQVSEGATTVCEEEGDVGTWERRSKLIQVICFWFNLKNNLQLMFLYCLHLLLRQQP